MLKVKYIPHKVYKFLRTDSVTLAPQLAAKVTWHRCNYLHAPFVATINNLAANPRHIGNPLLSRGCHRSTGVQGYGGCARSVDVCDLSWIGSRDVIVRKIVKLMGLAMNLGGKLCCKAITFTQMLGILSYDFLIVNSAFIEIISHGHQQSTFCLFVKQYQNSK